MSVQETNLRAIADAIREKDGTTGPIPAADFPERIRAIPAGGLPEEVYTISVEADPPEGGTVSGGGVASKGMNVSATITAEPNEGHTFSGWNLDGELVSSDKEYTFAVNRDISFNAIFSESASRLPNGYTEVEYIEPYGAQYIDTGIVVYPPAFRIKTVCIVNGVVNWFYGIIARTGTSSSNYMYSRFSSGANYQGKTVFINASYGNSSTINNPAVATINGVDFSGKAEVDVDLENKRLTVNGASTEISSVPSLFASSGNLFLFAQNNTYSTSNNYSNYKMCACQIFVSGKLTRDYVPCINPEGTAGLYDLVGQDFYKSGISGGSFTPGPAV